MKRLKQFVTLQKDIEIKLNSQITKYKTPKYCYIPVTKEYKPNKTEIKKEEQLEPNAISPISGTITGMKDCMLSNGKMAKCVVILNDYKEICQNRTPAIKHLDKVSKENIMEELKKYGCSSLAEKLEQTEKGSFLILNSIEDEPYTAGETFLNREYSNEILETLDVLREKWEAKEAKIYIKSTDRENIENYESHIGTYTGISLSYLPDFYLLEKPYFLKKYLHITEECLILKPSEVKKIYDIVKHHHAPTKTFLTISGTGIRNPQVLEVKIGTPLMDILKKYIQFKKERKIIAYVNGLMTGRSMNLSMLIVTEDLHSVIIMEKLELEERECINCGKCVSVCPVGCNPKKTYDTKQKKYVKNCIDCGLCSYICPSSINLRKRIWGDENE